MRDDYKRLAQLLETELSLPDKEEPEMEERVVPGGAGHAEGLSAALKETTVDLSTSRVRVGLTRGHLFEIVVQVPLDVVGGPEQLQVAAEVYCDERLGSELLDDWVACISVDRIARTQGLLMVSDARTKAQDYLIDDVVDLVKRGVEGVRAGLPVSLLSEGRREGDWTALDIPPSPQAPQPERRYASTRFPEALKCVLEGMPFSSQRFTRGPEVFSWVRWQPKGSAQERLSLRERLEACVVQASDTGRIALAGSGFGVTCDYLDLWADLRCSTLPSLLGELTSAVGSLQFGLYDTKLRRHPLKLSRP